jgi:hypothetical protein
VFTNVVIGTSFGVDPRETLVPRVWHILLIKTPADTLVLEQVDNSADILGNLGEWVTIKTEIITGFGQRMKTAEDCVLKVTYPPTAAM